MTGSSVRPIFLLSLPRSGSTLLQRLLSLSPGVATAAEPWFLLSWLGPLRLGGTLADYSHRALFRAVEDLDAGLPGGTGGYRNAVVTGALDLYTRLAAPGSTHFVDKTPRYHLIAAELLEAFPEADFILLWRNPLAVAASMIETWGRGRWELYRRRIDLYAGIENLTELQSREDGRLRIVRYEDLVANTEETMASLCRSIGLQHVPGSGYRVAGVHLEGRMGDPEASRRYSEVDTGSLERWRTTLGNPLRKAWARGYVKWIGQQRLSLMGYDLDTLMERLHAAPSRPVRLVSDAVRMAYGTLYPAIDPEVWRGKWLDLRVGRRLYAHR